MSPAIAGGAAFRRRGEAGEAGVGTWGSRPRSAWPRWAWCSLLALLLWLGALPRAHAGDPDPRWRTLETEHFYVHYLVGDEDAAERVAATAERAYDRLSVAWAHEVFLKIHVSLYDTQDTANGLATSAPYPNIIAYTTAPESLSVLEAYDDWIDILITHELTHVVHLDTVHGIPRLINAIFGFGVLGKVTQPNILQPRWVVEGVATMYESDFSAQGRRRSAQFDAFIRMAVLEGAFQSLDQVSSNARIWPHGTSVYLYGVHFMYYIEARYGRDKLTELSHLYGGRIVPFGINRAVRDVLGVDFEQLWKEFQEDTKRRFQAQARRIRSRGLRQGRRLTFSGETTRYPFWSPDDQYVYFFKADGHREEGIKRIAASGGRMREGIGIGRQGVDVDVQHVLDVEDSSSGSFVAATGDMVFDWVNTYDFRYRWSDLFRYNGGDPEEAEQLTFGLRASEPHVSPDGRTVVFRRNDIAQSRLGLLDLATGDVTEVPPMGRIAQVYSPRWSPDGRLIAFSGWREGGYRDLYLYEVATGTTRRITADRHMDIGPSWTPDGRYLLFSSDRDDVFNIYAYDMETERVHQVSNVLGGAFEPRVSNDGTRIAYVGYSRNGYDLWVMELDPERWLEAMPTVSDLPEVDDNKPPIEPGQTRPTSLRSHRYQAWRTMFPRSVFPTAADVATTQFGTSLGASLDVYDALGFHGFSSNVLYLFQQRALTGQVSYTYRRLLPSFGVSAGSRYTERGGFSRYVYDRRDDDPATYEQTGYRERNTYFGGDISLPVVRTARHSASAGVGYRWSRLTNLDADQTPIDPGAPTTQPPLTGDLAQVNLGVSYSNLGDGAGRFTYGTERGRRVNASLAIYDERLGGDYGDLQVSASYNEVFPMPWRGHQSLQILVQGGASAGGLRSRSYCVGNYGAGPEVLDGTDVLVSLLSRAGMGRSGCAELRGYGFAAQAGRYLALMSAEYRIPIIDVDRGLGTLPFFFQRMGMVPFVDWGSAFTDPIAARDLLLGAGASMAFTFRLGYSESIDLVLQYAHGFDDETGLDTFRVVVGSVF
ncbi:MAG: PD40 domain-containing protein [Myxococcales bacterium]|nr:PD40 domain-containing protein [Myxococcales bacterium]MCB9713041.1 PD40 domain-containing protein [Myxococcales bacterium]